MSTEFLLASCEDHPKTAVFTVSTLDAQSLIPGYEPGVNATNIENPIFFNVFIGFHHNDL